MKKCLALLLPPDLVQKGGRLELQLADLQTWKAPFLAETWDANYDDLLRTGLLIPR